MFYYIQKMLKTKSTCLLTLLALLAGSLMAENHCDDEGARCFQCIKDDAENETCDACLFDWSNGKCNHKTSVPKCFIATQSKTEDPKQCYACIIGYAPSEDVKSCQKMTVPHCLFGIRERAGEVFACTLCEKDKVLKNGACEDLPSDFKKQDHCVHHVESKGAVKCGLCEEGYSIDRLPEGSDSISGNCIKECTKGCFKCKGSNCTECNYLKGYFMTSVSKCSYRGFPEGFGNGLEGSSSDKQSGSLTSEKVLSFCLTSFTALGLLFW